MKSYSSNLFGAQALILVLIMLSTLKIQAFDIDRFDQSNAFILGEDLVAMPFGMQLLEANNANNAELVNHIDSLIDNYSRVKKIRILSHSYGGTHLLYSLDLIEQRIANKNKDLNIEIHFIASLLSPPFLLRLGCQFKTDFKDDYSMNIYNWKTIQEIDGAFRNYRKDPQEVSILSASQTRLPETYNGIKLGHNWSISWVADQISERN